MNCPIETRENAELLLAYCDRRLDPSRMAILEDHLAICPACREFASAQHAVWEALDSWEAAPVSADFDRRLYRRIEQEGAWWDRFLRLMRPLLLSRTLPFAAAATLLVVAGLMFERPQKPVPPTDSDAVEIEMVQPDQVVNALDDMEMLRQFNRTVHSAGDPKL